MNTGFSQIPNLTLHVRDSLLIGQDGLLLLSKENMQLLDLVMAVAQVTLNLHMYIE